MRRTSTPPLPLPLPLPLANYAAAATMSATNTATTRSPPTATTSLDPNDQATRLPDSRVNYNILSHHDRSKHMGTEGNSVSIIPPPRSPRADHPNVHPAISSFGEELPRSHDIGDFNIISNRYHQGHEVREKNDLRKLKVEAQTRYWQTHNYDPVVGRYYDIEKEDEYHKQKDALETVQGSCQVARLPPSIQYSEGSGYNILSHSVKDEQKLALASGVGNRAMKSKKGPVIEAEIRERAEELDRLVETRTMARISNTAPAREREQGRHHGYDMITNEPWQGRNNKPIPDSRLKAPNTVWAKLHSERDTAPMGTSIKVAAKPARDLSGAAPQNPASPSSYQMMTATAAARTTARQSLSARGANAGSGRGGSSASGAVRDIRPPTVPALRMPSNITALQNNYDVAPASAKPTPKPTPPPMPQSSSRPGVRTGGFN